MPYRLIREDGSELYFDTALSIKLSKRNRVTEHPVEDGSVTTDHIQPQPDTINMLAVLSETPITGTPHNRRGRRNIDYARRWLEEARQERLTVVGSKIGTLSPYALVDWSFPFTPSRSVKVQISLKQIRVSTATTVVITVASVTDSTTSTVSAEDDTVEDGALGMVEATDSGEQSTTDTSGNEATTEQDESVLSNWLGALS